MSFEASTRIGDRMQRPLLASCGWTTRLSGAKARMGHTMTCGLPVQVCWMAPAMLLLQLPGNAAHANPTLQDEIVTVAMPVAPAKSQHKLQANALAAGPSSEAVGKVLMIGLAAVVILKVIQAGLPPTQQPAPAAAPAAAASVSNQSQPPASGQQPDSAFSNETGTSNGESTSTQAPATTEAAAIPMELPPAITSTQSPTTPAAAATPMNSPAAITSTPSSITSAAAAIPPESPAASSTSTQAPATPAAAAIPTHSPAVSSSTAVQEPITKKACQHSESEDSSQISTADLAAPASRVRSPNRGFGASQVSQMAEEVQGNVYQSLAAEYQHIIAMKETEAQLAAAAAVAPTAALEGMAFIGVPPFDPALKLLARRRRSPEGGFGASEVSQMAEEVQAKVYESLKSEYQHIVVTKEMEAEIAAAAAVAPTAALEGMAFIGVPPFDPALKPVARRRRSPEGGFGASEVPQMAEEVQAKVYESLKSEYQHIIVTKEMEAEIAAAAAVAPTAALEGIAFIGAPPFGPASKHAAAASSRPAGTAAAAHASQMSDAVPSSKTSSLEGAVAGNGTHSDIDTAAATASKSSSDHVPKPIVLAGGDLLFVFK